MIITVRVHARASRSKTRWNGSVLEVWVTAPPVGGAANKAVLRAVADQLGVPVSVVILRSGEHGRTKMVEVLHATAGWARTVLPVSSEDSPATPGTF